MVMVAVVVVVLIVAMDDLNLCSIQLLSFEKQSMAFIELRGFKLET